MRHASLLVVLAIMAMFAPRSAASATAQAAQTDMSGEWAVSFSTPQGPLELTMYVMQQGPRLTGRLTGEYGEFPLRGTIDGAAFTITWSLPDGGRSVDITFTGTVDGDSLSGTAKLGTRGSGPLSGTRTGQ
jgi:hypothetical protein